VVERPFEVFPLLLGELDLEQVHHLEEDLLLQIEDLFQQPVGRGPSQAALVLHLEHVRGDRQACPVLPGEVSPHQVARTCEPSHPGGQGLLH
jgi:hypothetical protein